jgi:predicted GIY-YIG superfamily endonuclease
MNYCYLLYIPGSNRTYIGATNDPAHRLRQHNGELAGGAKATKGKQWTQAFYVSGFPDWSNTLQFEWAWKRQSRNQPGLKGKIVGLRKLLALDRATTTATPYAYWANPVAFHITPQQRTALQKIDTASFLLETQHPSSMSSSNQTFESLSAQIADMATELSIVQTRLAEALKKLEPKVVPAKKAATPKDPNAEKKPLTSYMLFCDRTRKAAPIGTTYSPKQLGDMWKALSDDQKADYKA